MYSKERASLVTKNEVTKYILPGIVANVKLVSAKYENSPSSSFIQINFEKDGAIFSHTEWKPGGKFDVDAESLQKKEDNQFSRMMQLLLCFYTNDQLIFNGTSFEEFAKEVVSYLNNANKDILLRVKIVYNDKGYTTLPKYARYTFIEPMILGEGKESSIVELSFDQFTKPVIADTEVENNPLGAKPLVETQTILQTDNSAIDALPF